jgi:8-oxo-dGTP diphosphatase
MTEAHIHKAAGILIRDKKLLVSKSKNKDFYVAPGGKVEEGETMDEALVRELDEEFGIQVDESGFERYGDFYDEAAGNPGVMLHMQAFIVKFWEGEPTPSGEIEKIKWITSNIPKDIKVGSIFEHQIIPRLKGEGLIE